ncbi:MAG: hypothetical protein E7448_08015 [Ruminococcaceae bacterium]|nr:hypothetical protein [Oscillospiraceae bacterium]
MKDLKLLVWISQLGLSVVVPPAMFILLALWLRDSRGWGSWVLWVGIGLGIYGGICGFVSSLRTLRALTAKQEKDPPPVSYNDHH